MSNSNNTLDELLHNLGDSIDPHGSDDGDYDTAKQAILHWIATEIIGEDEHVNKNDGSILIFLESDLMKQKQRDILKAHGWKEVL